MTPTAHSYGQRSAVIVANGSSVDAIPPDFWRWAQTSLLLIGTNRVLCFDSLQSITWSVLVMRDTYRNLWHDMHVGCKYHQELWKPNPAYKVGPADRRTTHCDEYMRQVEGFQLERVTDHNHEAAVMLNSSVALMAANVAWLMGSRELYFIGVDYCGPHARMIDPYQSQSPGWEGQYDKPVPEHIERQFGQMRQSVESAGGHCFNLNPQTKLKALEIADSDHFRGATEMVW